MIKMNSEFWRAYKGIPTPKVTAELLNGGGIYIFSGDQPHSPDEKPTGTLLSIVRPRGGIKFCEEENTTRNAIVKDFTGSWQGMVKESGVAGWFRLYGGWKWGRTNIKLKKSRIIRYKVWLDGGIGPNSDMVAKRSDTYLSKGCTFFISHFLLEMPQ